MDKWISSSKNGRQTINIVQVSTYLNAYVFTIMPDQSVTYKKETIILISFFLFFRYWTMDRSLQRRLQKTNYQHIKRLCRDRGQLFEDIDFPPIARSLYKNKKPGFHPVVWLRPHVRRQTVLQTICAFLRTIVHDYQIVQS